MRTTKIKIRNLFGITETELDGRSVELTGTNGVGKTSVIDALRYALTNKSDRNIIVKQGEKEGEILIETDTGLSIDRKKRTEQADYKSVKENGKEIMAPENFLRQLFTPLQLDPVAFTLMDEKSKNRAILDLIEFEWDLNYINEKFGEIPSWINYEQNILEVLSDMQSENGQWFKERQNVNRDIRNKQAFIEDIAKAIADLHSECPTLKSVVLKLNEGFSGIGNILIDLADIGDCSNEEAIVDYLERFSDDKCGEVSWQAFKEVLADQGGVVEAFIDAPGKTSPTIQISINPLGDISIDSTHEQELGGRSGLEYIGCSLPAKANYVQTLHHLGKEIGRELVHLGAVGPASIDFIAIPRTSSDTQALTDGVVYGRGDYMLYAVEINLRRGGTTHPLNATSFLTGGRYNSGSGTFKLPSGREVCYVSFSNIAPPEARGLCPNDIIDIVTEFGLHYNSSTCSGVLFHMMGALSQFGRLSGTCVAESHEKAWQLVENVREILAREAKELSWLS